MCWCGEGRRQVRCASEGYQRAGRHFARAGGVAESVEYNIKIMYIAAIIARSGATKHAMGALQPVERWLVRCGCDDGLRCEPFATGLILPFERGLQEGDFVGRQVEQPIDDCVDLALRRGYLVR